jgi:hypothetical protein
MPRKIKATHHRVEVTVCGEGRFPLDMLRYDQCAPRTSSDASAIVEPNFRLVSLNAYNNAAVNSGQVVTVARWESFGWYVLTANELAAYHSNPSIDAVSDLHVVIQSRNAAKEAK